MPCLSGTQDEMDRYQRRLGRAVLTRGEMEAVLCGLFRAVGKHSLDGVLDRVDWNEVGVKKDEVLKWWEQHQREDQARAQFGMWGAADGKS